MDRPPSSDEATHDDSNPAHLQHLANHSAARQIPADIGIQNGMAAITTGGIVNAGHTITTAGRRAIQPPHATLTNEASCEEEEKSLCASSYNARSNNQLRVLLPMAIELVEATVTHCLIANRRLGYPIT